MVAGDKSGQLAIWNVHPREEDYRAPSSAEVETAGSGIGESIEKKAEDGNEEEGGDGCQGLHTFLIHESVVSGLAVPAWDHHASVVHPWALTFSSPMLAHTGAAQCFQLSSAS